MKYLATLLHNIGLLSAIKTCPDATFKLLPGGIMLPPLQRLVCSLRVMKCTAGAIMNNSDIVGDFIKVLSVISGQNGYISLYIYILCMYIYIYIYTEYRKYMEDQYRKKYMGG